MKYLKLLILMAFIGAINLTGKAQEVALKTNIIPDALASPNLGVEVGLAPKWTLDITGEVNMWEINKHKWKHWLAQPEARYWFCERFAGHFLGIHLLGGQYNFGNIHNNINFLGSDFSQLTEHRFQGWAAGGGIAYGFACVLDRHWNLEFELGIGYLYTRFDRYSCVECGKLEEPDLHHNYYGPTKIAINLEYVF